MAAAVEAGISRKILYAMRDEGVLDQLSRGVYRLASLPGLESPDLVAVAARVPKAVVCLISAGLMRPSFCQAVTTRSGNPCSEWDASCHAKNSSKRMSS